MFKRNMLFFLISAFLWAAILTTALYGNENEEKIARGLDMALEAITIAGNHTMAEGTNFNDLSDDSADHSESEGYSSGKENSHSRDQSAENTYRKSFKVSNPLITEPIKIQKKKYSVKTHVPAPIHKTVHISPGRPWTRTGIVLKQGDIVKIFCKGKVLPGDFEYRYKNTSCLSAGFHFDRGNLTIVPNARYLGVTGKINNMDPFYIGEEKQFVSHTGGYFYLGVNELIKSEYTGAPINKRTAYYTDNTGEYIADIYIYRN